MRLPPSHALEHVQLNVFTYTVPPATPAPPSRVDGPAVSGPRAVTAVTGWCAVVLVAVNVPLGMLLMLTGGVWPAAASLGYVLALAAFVALVPVAVVGWPVGWLTARVLRPVDRERTHVAAFAGVGAVTSVALLVVPTLGGGWPVGVGWGLVLLYAAEGALGAGGGRWLAGRVRRRRADAGARPCTHDDREDER